MNAERERETRCYAVEGTIQMLDGLERVLRRMEAAGERNMVQILTLMIDGRDGESLRVRVLASWIEEEENTGAGEGFPLPYLAEEREPPSLVMVGLDEAAGSREGGDAEICAWLCGE